MSGSAGAPPSSPPALVLIGGGHAHVHVLESLATAEWPSARTILISPDRQQIYSGMVPGMIQGRYRPDEVTIDLPALCRAAGAEFVDGRVESIDAGERVVRTAEGIFPFTLASMDVGSVAPGSTVPGVQEHAWAAKPLSAALALCRRLDELARGEGVARVAVVGGGPGGIELGLAARRRVEERGAAAELTIVERGDRILEGFPAAARTRVGRVIRRRGGRVRTGQRVTAVDEDAIRLDDGSRVEVDITIWATGAAPPPLLRDSSLPLSRDGYLAVDARLRAVDGSPVWGAGDCVDLQHHPLPKAGVFAVREGPVLAHNLRAALLGEAPREYHPQSRYLVLLDTADGKAVLRRGRLVLHGRPALWLKERIDRAFVRRFARHTKT